MQTTDAQRDRPRLWEATTDTPQRPAGATGKDIMARTITAHRAVPFVDEGRVVIIDCADESCGFQSSYVTLVGVNGIWEEHAHHITDLLEQAGIGETAEAVANERLRLAGKLDEEVAYRNSLDRTRWTEATLGWTQAADHLRHPTATN